MTPHNQPESFLEDLECSDCCDLQWEIDDLNRVVEELEEQISKMNIYELAVKEILGEKFCNAVSAEFNVQKLKEMLK